MIIRKKIYSVFKPSPCIVTSDSLHGLCHIGQYLSIKAQLNRNRFVKRIHMDAYIKKGSLHDNSDITFFFVTLYKY